MPYKSIEQNRAYDNAYYKKNKKRIMERSRAFYEANREKMLEYERERYKRNKERKANYSKKIAGTEKQVARKLFFAAVRAGRLVRKPCEVCTEKKSDGHHEDYKKPLEVIWLCHRHHMERHRKII